jgi:hypothetical protein
LVLLSGEDIMWRGAVDAGGEKGRRGERFISNATSDDDDGRKGK